MSIKTDTSYQCKVTALWVELTPNKGVPIVQINCLFGKEWDGEKWIKLEAPLEEMTCGFFPFKGDGTVSDFTWKALQEATGWAGDDLGTLEKIGETVERKPMYVQIKTETDDKNYIQGKWLSRWDTVPRAGGGRLRAPKKTGTDWSKFTARGPVAAAKKDDGFGDLSIDPDSVPF